METKPLLEGLALTEPGATVEVAGVSVSADTVHQVIRSGGLELDGLPPRELNVVLQLCEVACRRTDATLTQVAEVIDRRQTYAADGHRGLRGQLKASVRWSNHQARGRGDILRTIRQHELVRSEYVAGRLGLAQMAELARLACHPRAGVLFGEFESLLVDDAQHLEYEDFKQVTARWLLLVDPDGADRDEALKHYTRSGCCITSRDGMVHLEARFAGAQGQAVKEIFDRFYDAENQADWQQARAEHGDGVSNADLARTDEQRRADAVHSVFGRAAGNDQAPKAAEPVVEMIVDQQTAEAVIARHAGIEVPPDPSGYRHRRCEYANGEPAAPSDVLAALIIGQLRRVLVDSAGVVIDLGRRSRLFTGSSRTAAQLAHWHCTHPGCGVPTKWSQVDHVTNWRDHGPTEPGNAHIKCGFHNRWKETGITTWRDTHGRWRQLRPDGTELLAV